MSKVSNPQQQFITDLDEVLGSLREMLIDKNRKYGDSALNPVRIFSRSNTLEQIDVRLDDKLSRLRNRQDDDAEDVYQDTLGYLIMRQIAVNRLK